MKLFGALFVAPVLVIGLAVAACSDGDSEMSGVEPPGDSEPAFDVASWTEHRDCGYAFFAGNANGTQQLVASRALDAEPDEPTVVELPSPQWQVVVQLGRHFGEQGFAGSSCTDVIDGNDPAPKIDTEWDVVAGTLTIEADRDGGFPATAVLTAEGLVAQSPDGERVPLDDIRVVSTCWGCLQG